MSAEFADRLYLVLAQQRSGSCYFRALLRSSGMILAPGEVIHNDRKPGDAAYQANYHRMKEELFGRQPELSIPSPHNQRRIVEYWFRQVTENLFPQVPRIQLDVKFNVLHFFEPARCRLADRSFFIDLLAHWNIPLIFLHRENYLHSIISMHVASDSGQYIALKDRPLTAAPIRIEPTRLLHQLHITDLQFQAVRRWLSGYPRLIEVNYRLIGGSSEEFADQVIAPMNRLMGLNLPLDLKERYDRSQGAIVKSIKDYRRQLENYDAIAEAIRNSPYAYMLPDETSGGG
jgi:LPS sulfotransferase NodH